MTIIRSYRNGNTLVMLHGDGTKVREWEGSASPMFPESVDLKITNQCDGGCAWCHEDSKPDGAHADPQWIVDAVKGLPRGVEIAIGGGNPFTHPELGPLCRTLARRGLIVNLTVNSRHLRDAAPMIRTLRAVPALWGLGVSWGRNYERQIDAILGTNTVIHTILGLHSMFDIAMVAKKYPKVLVLGYKEVGRGKTFTDVYHENHDLAWHLMDAERSGVIAFDNLAIEQMGLKERLPELTWAERYMGDDGQFTMYVDAVTQRYAVSSTSAKRNPMGTMTIAEAFRKVHESRP